MKPPRTGYRFTAVSAFRGAFRVTLLGVLLGAMFSLLPLGCGRQDDPAQATPAGKRIRTATDRFGIGQPDRYATEKVYDDFYQSHGVYLVHFHGMLVALSAVSPNSDHTVRYDPAISQYLDPRDGSRYTRDGLPTGPPADRKALERCRIDLSTQFNGLPQQIVVDPSYRFLFEDNRWSNAHSYFPTDGKHAGNTTRYP